MVRTYFETQSKPIYVVREELNRVPAKLLPHDGRA